MFHSILKRFLFVLFAVSFISSVSFGSETNKPFTLGGITVAPGEAESGYLPVPLEDGPETFIPLTIINGLQQGKTLSLVAGVHGYEYPPILALYRLKKMIDPKNLSGTIILVHIANIHSFRKRTIYYNPYDWKNLNRVFPGDPQGTISQRVAHVIKTEIVDRCDCLIDMHCGDGNEALIPYTYWMVTGDEKLDEISRQMALAFGLKHIIIDQSRTQDISDSKYLGNTAVLNKKPAITTESGYLGRTDEESIVRNINGILNVMRLFKMIEGEPHVPSEPVWIDRYEVVYSEYDGLFYPLTEMGYYAKKGEEIGYLTDYLGNVVQELHAPFTGIVLYIIDTPPANKGEPLFEIGSVQNK
jgi:predicted deacylase